MMEEEFLRLLNTELDRDQPLKLDDHFKDEWDSLSTLALMSLVDEHYGVVLGAAEVLIGAAVVAPAL